IEIVARPGNGRLAVEALERLRVDVTVLDIEMPVLDGLTALPLLLKAQPGLRVIMASTLTTRAAEVTLRALQLGAIDYVPKPTALGNSDAESFARELLRKIKGLMLPGPSGSRPGPSLRPRPHRPPCLLAIGCSTGGPQALLALARDLGTKLPVPVVMTQHMPAMFTTILAQNITRQGGAPCAEAREGERLIPGRIYLAPGDRHLLVEGEPSQLRARLSDAPPMHFCRPAVDRMLISASSACPAGVLALMLTGMGQDGLLGTRAIVEGGGSAIAQDEASSVVWGMPGAVAQAGLCHAVLPLDQIAPKVLELLNGDKPDR
ncbi:MAG: chemotaxis-specific protein-glutamate methyltransferase CheB, partial [Acetobacteraceae bacterium]